MNGHDKWCECSGCMAEHDGVGDGFVAVVCEMPIAGFDITTGQMDTIVVFKGAVEVEGGEETQEITFGVDHRMAADIILAVSTEDEDGDSIAICYVEDWQVLSRSA